MGETNVPDPSPETAVVALAEVLASKAVDGWRRLVWRATLTSAGLSARAEVVLADGTVSKPASAMIQLGLLADGNAKAAVDRLEAALRTADGAVAHTVELAVKPGRVNAAASTELELSGDDYHLVVGPNPRPPHEDGPDAEAAAPQGDPARVIELAEEYQTLYTGIMGTPPALRPPARPDEIAAAEAALGVTFPPDLRALYLMADGEDSDYGLFGGPTFLPLAWVVNTWREYGTADDDDAPVIFEADPRGAIRRVPWHPHWIPFANHHDGNLYAVDLAPGPRGTVGQVIQFGGSDEEGEPVSYMAGSVTDLLATLVAMLRAGDVDADPGERLWIFPYGETEDLSHHVREPLADWLATLPDPGVVQELWVHDTGTVDLSPLAALPRLRALRVQRANEVTGLHALTSCPLELLHIAGEVDDISPVAGLPGLRHLALGIPEWTELLADHPQPPNLVAATLTGPASLIAAATWARRLAPSTAAPWHHSATW